MTNEEKQLLFIDLCARLPYGIKFPYHIDEDNNHRECDCVATIDTINEDTIEFTYYENGTIRDWSCSIKEVKPYLRPLSSMSDEERKEYKSFIFTQYHEWDGHGTSTDYVETDDVERYFTWLNKKGFDYRGLIPMGLALVAPEEI